MQFFFVRVAVVLVSVVLGGGSAFAFDKVSFFNSAETMSDNLQPFTKWNDMVARYRTSGEMQDTGCGGAYMPCKLKPWKHFLSTLQNKDRISQIRAVNEYANEHPYITDPANWQQDDYWAAIRQFLIKDGDCEDYAIAKFFSLKALGFRNDEMRIVVLKDMNLKVMHAILVVFEGGKTWALDNQIKQVVETNRIYHYVPFYSINETHWWRHHPL